MISVSLKTTSNSYYENDVDDVEIYDVAKSCSMERLDVNEIDKAFIKGVTFHYVKTMQQVVDLALV